MGVLELCDREALDLVGPAFIEFSPDRSSSFGFIAMSGSLDCRGAQVGRAAVEFSWEGTDDGDEVSGRGWAALQDDGSLHGHIYFHLGDDSDFVAVRPDGGFLLQSRAPLPARRVRSSDR